MNEFYQRLLTGKEMLQAYQAIPGDRAWGPRDAVAIAIAQDAKTTAYWGAQLAKLLALMEAPVRTSAEASPK